MNYPKYVQELCKKNPSESERYIREWHKKYLKNNRIYWRKWWLKKHPGYVFRYNRAGKKPFNPDLETRKKLSEAKKGAKNFNWRGGVSRDKRHCASMEYREWRKAVYQRDGYKCVWCGDDTGGNLEADHIQPWAMFPDLRYEVSNGRTLCKPCHRKTDTWGTKTKMSIRQVS